MYFLYTPLFLFISVLVIQFGNRKIEYTNTKEQFDERDVIFSRMELEKGSQKFNDYYHNQPQNKPLDDTFRQEPGLLQPGAKYYHPLMFKAAKATFSAVSLLQPLVEGQPFSNQTTNFRGPNFNVY